MGRILALYLLFWGIGLVLDPRLQDYKALGFIGLALIGGAMMFLDYDIRYPLEFDDYAMKRAFKNIPTLAILSGMVIVSALILAFYFYVYPLP